MRELHPRDVDRIVVHCTAGNPWATKEAITDWFVAGKGWEAPGYHFAFHPDGAAMALRPIWNVGAHAKTGGYNSRALGLAWTGSFEDAPPPPAAWGAMVTMCATLCTTYDIDADGVMGHREVYDAAGERRLKTCPGMAVDLDKLRADVRASHAYRVTP